MTNDEAQQVRRILVIETAAPLGGLLVATRRAGAGEAAELEIVEHLFREPHQHAQMLVPALRDLLLPGGPGPHDLLLVDRGPGSHTGTRIGLAVAKMIAWQAGTRAVGLVSLDALAWMFVAASGHVPAGGEVVAVLPCRTGLVYARRYRVVADGEGGLLPQQLEEPAVVEVGAGFPPAWRGLHAIGAGLEREPTLQAAAAAGEWHALPEQQGAWPSPQALLALGLASDAQAQDTPPTTDEQTRAASLEPLYLAPVTAQTLAERRAAGIVR